MEISQTFDGSSAPVKKTTINRWEEYLNGEVQIQESTATVYYLRSTALGGKVIAQLDETGYKWLGYVFAGGMQIATQHVWSPGSGFGVAWTTTSPATGSEYMVGGPYLSRKELDPLGADVTEPPQPQLVLEPVFYNPKFDQMPLQIEGGPSDEYEQNNADWASLVTATIQAAQQRDRAEKLWQSGKRSEAMAILNKNPNVGIEYRALVNGEVVQSGSYFGKDAADFLNGINIALGAGLLSPVTEQSGATRHHPQNSGTEQPLSDTQKEIVKDVMGTAVNFIQRFPDCAHYVASNVIKAGNDPATELNELQGSMMYFNGVQFSADEGRGVAGLRGGFTRRGSGPVHITLGYLFFHELYTQYRAHVFGLSSPKLSRVVTFLHEYKHYTERRPHIGRSKGSTGSLGHFRGVGQKHYPALYKVSKCRQHGTYRVFGRERCVSVRQ